MCINDTLVCSANRYEHKENLKTVFEVLGGKKVFAKPRKCASWLEAISCLGHVVYKDGNARDPKHIETIWLNGIDQQASDWLAVCWDSMVTNTGSLRDSRHCPGLLQSNEKECPTYLERTMRSKCFGAHANTGFRSFPHVAHEIRGARSVNVCILKKIGMCTRATRQSGSLCHKAIELPREKPSYPRLKVCGSVLRLEDTDAISQGLAVWSSYRS